MSAVEHALDRGPLTTSRASAAAAARAWRELDARLPDAGITAGVPWVGTWLSVFGDHEHDVVVARRHDEVRGALLLVRDRGPRHAGARVRVVHLGTAGVLGPDPLDTPVNRLLCLPGAETALAEALAAHVADDPLWDELRCEALEPTTADVLADAFPGSEVDEEERGWADLRPARRTGTSVVTALDVATHRELCRSTKDLGPLQGRTATSVEEALEILDELLALRRSAWEADERPGVPHSERFVAFHRALVPRLLERRQVVLHRVRARSGTVGCVYGLVDRGRCVVQDIGLADPATWRARPGLVTHVSCMDACAERGLDAYELPRDRDGDPDDDRARLVTGTALRVSLVIRRPRARLAPGLAVLSIRRRPA